MDKNDLRRKYKKVRQNVKFKYIKSLLIYKKLLKFLNKDDCTAFYYSFGSEVITLFMIKKLLKKGFKICLPSIDENTNLMDFYLIDKDTIFKKNKYSILEPINSLKVEPNEINTVIVPGICFDKEGNRIGCGKGYYDRFLSYKMFSIGLSFESCISNESISIDKYDKKVKMIITDKRIIRSSL